jgi:hypothetical protein
LDLAVEATREFKSTLGIDVYVETMKNVLREADLGSTEKILKLALSAKNVKILDRRNWGRMVFSKKTIINRLCFDGISWYWICGKKNLPIQLSNRY